MAQPQYAVGLIRAIPDHVLAAAQLEQDNQRADAAKAQQDSLSGLAAYINQQFEMMRSHRNNGQAGWSTRLIEALRTFNGQYDPTTLGEIQQFGGSQIYSRLVAMKCRGASALLRDVYLAPDRPWGISAPDDPNVPDEIVRSISELVAAEVQSMAAAQQQQAQMQAQMQGQAPDQSGAIPAPMPAIDPAMIRDRIAGLMMDARAAAKKKASVQAKVSEDRIDEMLNEGGFYRALAEFLVDLPLFPFACLKGPVVRVLPQIEWQEGRAVSVSKPKLFWQRISPFDLWWTPGASDIEDASVIERTRVTRADLNDLLDLPGYDTEAVRAVLHDYGSGGLSDNWDMTDSERATMESRENPVMNRSGMITCLEFNGNVQGKLLIDHGIPAEQIPDPLRDYMVQAWKIGRYIIKVQLSPSPRKRHPYFITSFEKVPGTPVGNGLPDILADLQSASNATLRALINNMSIASGPQVVVNVDRLSADEDGQQLYPWKRWKMLSDPTANSAQQKPVDFFQPNSNAQELLAVYQQFTAMADELSGIPKYLTGSGASGGAGRTASGLAMLMGNASKLLQTVAANIDRDVMYPLLTQLFDMIMLTDTTGLLSGEETVKVMGVNVAIQRETQRSRQLEFLQITANPADMQIVGPRGRASVLRAVAGTIGLDGEEIVPSDDELQKQQAVAEQLAAQQGQPGHGGMGQNAAEAQGNQPQKGGDVTGDNGPRTAIAGGSH